MATNEFPPTIFLALLANPLVAGGHLRERMTKSCGCLKRETRTPPKESAVYEPRPRGKFIGERADGRRVSEAEHFFRCTACDGWIDLRDLAWVEDHEGPLPHPAQDGIQ